MAFQTFNNNVAQDRPNVTTYTPISLANPESKIQASRLTINYFNKMLQLKISPRMPASPNEMFPTYAKDGAVSVFLSYTQAKMLCDGIRDVFLGPNKEKHNNICLETKNGLLVISNGIEVGSSSPIVKILYTTQNNSSPQEIIYQTKNNYELPCDYSEGKYSTIKYPNMEIEVLAMIFEQYYMSASYAIAASVRDANLYETTKRNDLIKAVAQKVGVDLRAFSPNNGTSNNYSSYSFLQSSQDNYNTPVTEYSSAQTTTNIPKAYQSETFDDVVRSSIEAMADISEV